MGWSAERWGKTQLTVKVTVVADGANVIRANYCAHAGTIKREMVSSELLR